MTLPYENATSGGKALSDLNAILTKFGCTRFGTMTDIEKGELLVQFSYKGRDVSARASYRGYAAAWLKEHPYTVRTRITRQKHEEKALRQAEISVCSILRDWIKGQVMAIETGILTFEGAFLGQIMLGNGRTLLEAVQDQNLLPAPEAVK
ncbi:hypothetical protein TKWG_14160 [Advenella kashmirensis WT001]|uniref:Uncharacterized protein n=1 Tax=Advenella kashmirensis (strain DSM 17095 / LMG 22695 / WT001) TaxID=1036672 RepID=I3UD22_ADVKW|nr:hypothetical protein [Advenella kashmirensis]AFK62910.1 hypothetical protein TKWG_14160 [Advenella kashmirensis WT001]